MFFNITNPQGPTEVYKYINTAVKNGFKPANVFEVLNRTNNYVVIKKMLNEIKKLPNEEQKEFKDVVIASLEGRDVSTDSRFLITELAINGGYDADLVNADQKEKIYKGIYIVESKLPLKKKKNFFNKAKTNSVE